MLRKGMPASKGKSHSLTTKAAALLVVVVVVVVAVAVASASWSLSAEEPIRVAARTTAKARQQPGKNQLKLWDVLPGRTGYWRVNVDAAMKHPVIGQWLNQADALFLTPGWKMVARDEAKDRRADLGLSLKNVSSISGSVNMQTKMIDKAKTDHDFHTSVTAHEFVMRMQRDVDWSMVAAALPEDRIDKAIAGLVGPDFPEKAAQKMIKQDVIAGFFEQQTDPRQFMLRQDSKDETADEQPSATSPIIPALWKDHGGELATMVVQLPSMSGHTETRLQKRVEALHKAAEYYVVGVDLSDEPGKVRLRAGLTPRGETSAEELSKILSDVIQAAIDQPDEEDPDDVNDETDAAILQFLEQAKPVIRKSAHPSLPDTVIIEGDLIPSALWLAIAG